MSDLHVGPSESEPNVCPCCERADESAIRNGKELHRLTVTLRAIARHPSGTSRSGEAMRRWAQRTLDGLTPWEEPVEEAEDA